MGKFSKRLKANGVSHRMTLAVTLDRPKTAALAFDRVYAGSDAKLPGEITPGFAWLGTNTKAQKDPFIRVYTSKDGKPRPEAMSVASSRETLEYQLRANKDRLFGALGREGYRPVEFLDHVEQTYTPGNDPFIFATLEGVMGIDEESLNWAQVGEFRKDKDASIAYRGLVRWFDKECKDMKQHQAEDHVVFTYESGQAALKKHGIVPAFGAITTLLSPAVVGLLTASFWAAGIVFAGSAGITVTAKLNEIRLQRKESKLVGPLAYIQKLERLPKIRQAVAAETRAKLAAGRDIVEDL